MSFSKGSKYIMCRMFDTFFGYRKRERNQVFELLPRKNLGALSPAHDTEESVRNQPQSTKVRLFQDVKNTQLSL